jgi:hypothetical protein
VPVLQALAQLRLGRARLQAHEGVGEVVVDVVVLRRKVVALGLALLAGQRGMLEALVHVVRDRPHVVEELGVHRPAVVLFEHGLADQLLAAFGHGVGQSETLTLDRHVAQAFVRRAVFVRRFGRAGKPPLVDAAAVSAVGIPVARGQLDPLAGMQEAARHPGGRKPQQALAGVQRAAECFGNVVFLQRGGSGHDGDAKLLKGRWRRGRIFAGRTKTVRTPARAAARAIVD